MNMPAGASPAFQAVAQQQISNREFQRYKYQYVYTLSAIIEPSQTIPFFLQIEQDADFQFEKITGRVLGPVDTVGLYDAAGLTDFPQPGTTGGAPTFAGSGLTVDIVDQGAGRDLSRGFLPIENILTPGYDVGMYLPYPFKYFAKRNSNIKFTFRNRDTQARQAVDISVCGFKYQMPEMRNNIESPSQIMADNSSRSSA